MLVKYMGIADEKHLPVGYDGDGQFSEKLTEELVWSASNRWVLNSDDYSDIDPDFWSFLVETFPTDFKDVSAYKRIPVNLHQTTFLGMPEGSQLTEKEEAALAEERRKAIAADLAEDVERSNFLVDVQEADTKADLEKIAKKAGVELKSSMTKEEMVKALTDHLNSGGSVNTSPGGAVSSAGTTTGGNTGGTTSTSGSGAGRGGVGGNTASS